MTRFRTFVLFTLPASIFGFAAACSDNEPVPTPRAASDAGQRQEEPEESQAEEQPSNTPPKSTFDAGDPACSAPTNPSRGVEWVRTNPMVVAGLNAGVGAPDAGAVTEYFGTFHATAVHLSASGLRAEISAWAAAQHPSFRWISWVAADGTSTENGFLLGGDAGIVPGRIGYQIGDQPETTQALQAILAGAAAVKAADPAGLRILNVNDTTGANDLVDTAAQAENVDVLSYASFAYGTGALNGLMRVRTAAQAAKKPYWRYAKGFYPTGSSPDATSSDLRWDAYVGAVFGFTGLTWHVYSVDAQNQTIEPLFFDAKGDYGATKSAFYATAASLNAELTTLGKTLSVLRSTDVRYVAAVPALRPTSIQVWDPAANSDPYLKGVTALSNRDLLVGHFKDDCGEPYVLMQNQSHEGGDAPNASPAAASFRLSFDFTGAPAGLEKAAVLAMDPATGAVAPRQLAATGAETADLVVDLPAGGVLFFKYKSGRPFASQ